MISIQDNVLDYVEILSTYVPLFERWTTLFRPSDYTDLATSIKRTCAEFFNYLVDSLRFFGRSAFSEFDKSRAL